MKITLEAGAFSKSYDLVGAGLGVFASNTRCIGQIRTYNGIVLLYLPIRYLAE